MSRATLTHIESKARTCSAENTWLEHTLREHAKRNLNTQKTWHGCVLQRTHDWGTHIENIPSATLTHIENMAGVCSAENTWLGHTHWEHVQCNLNTHRKHGRGVFYREHMTRAHTFRTCPAQPQLTQKAWQGRVLQNTWLGHTLLTENMPRATWACWLNHLQPVKMPITV